MHNTKHNISKICDLAKSIRQNRELGYPNHENFFEMVQLAKGFSHDQDTQVGCVISTLDEKNFVLGANRLTKGVKWSHERTVRPTKYEFIEHGERTAIPRFIKKYGHKKLAQSKIYLDGYPCPECTRQLSLFGVREIWLDETFMTNWTDNPIWYEREKKSKEILAESDIKVFIYAKIIS